MRDRPASIGACPPAAVLARAVSEGADETLAAHLRGCVHCAEVFRSHRELIMMASRIPVQSPSAERRHRLRHALLESLPPAPGAVGASITVLPFARGRRGGGALPARLSARRLLALGGALAAAAAIALVVPRWRASHPGAAEALATRAIIEPQAGARFVRLTGAPDEVIRLYQGTVRFGVTPATHGETFRVITGTGEVEVRGTIFETTALEDRLVGVSVQRGRVVVRDGSSGGQLSLEAGRSWTRPPDDIRVATPDTTSFATGEAAAPASRAPTHGERSARNQHNSGTRRTALQIPASPEPHARAFTPAEQAYGEGLALLRGADPAGAARAFERAALLSPLGTLAEDATYFRAVALTRAGKTGTSHEALVAFLDRFPSSAWAGEASVMLGWLLLDRSDLPAAVLRFQAGLADPSPRVRKSARAGLEAVNAKVPPAPPPR